MTAYIANVVQSTDSFGQWLAKTNQIITVISNTAVTTNSNTAVGNAAITGKFSANAISLSNTGFLKIGSGSSNSSINASVIIIQSSPTTNTIITDTGVYLSGTAFYTDVVMSLGNSVIRSSNITADSFVLKNTLRLGNTYLSSMHANTNNIFAINTIRVGDVEANVYIDRDGLQIRRDPTAASGFANAKMTNDTLWIKNINANTLTIGTITYTVGSTLQTFPSNTHFLSQNNYFRFGLTSNANIELINGSIGIGTTSPEAPIHISSTGASTGILVESTESGAGTGPDIVFRRNSASPAAGDNLAGIFWQGKNSIAATIDYAQLISEISSATSGAESTNVILTQKVAGVDKTTLYINGAGNIGLGTTSPEAPIHISSITAGTGILVESTESGDSTGPDIVFRRNSTSPAVGDNLAGVFWQGKNSAAATVNYAQLISEIASPTSGSEGTNIFLIQKIAGADTRTLHISSAGFLGLGTSAPIAKLDVRGNAYVSGAAIVAGTITAGNNITAYGNITAFFSSDERLKENIANISNPLEKLALLNGVTFDWTDSYIESQGGLDKMFVRKNDVGIIAQDLEKVLPQLVAERDDGYKAVKYDRIVALLIEAVKELKAEVDSLKNGN